MAISKLGALFTMTIICGFTTASDASPPRSGGAVGHTGSSYACESSTVFKSNEWRLISLPCAHGGRTVNDLFGSEGYGEYGIGWRIYRFNSKAKKYEDLGQNGMMEPGRGYWFIQTTGRDQPYSISGETSPTTFGFYQCRQQGCVQLPTESDGSKVTFQLAGNPYHYTVSASDFIVQINHPDCRYEDEGCGWQFAHDHHILNKRVRTYDNKVYKDKDMTQPNTKLDAWEGFFITVLKDEQAHPVSVSIELAKPSNTAR